MPTPGGLRPAHVTPRRLRDLAARAQATVPTDAGAASVTGVTLDSRSVLPGDLYAALRGAHVHGASFCSEAAASGAVAVLTDAQGAPAAAAAGLPVLVSADPRAVLGEVAADVYGRPAEALLMLGVTGTNGKTTTTYLLDAGLQACGLTTGLVGTIETRVAARTVDSVRTTPEATDVHALLACMVEQGVHACSMEVSSHAMALHRVDGVVFDVVAFTNLSQDHLDFHPTMEDYFTTKAGLFTPARARRGVVCVDDAWGVRLAAEAGIPVATLASRPDGAGWGGAQWRVVDREAEGALVAFTLAHRDGRRLRARSALPGEFNVANTALALLMLTEAGQDAHAASAAVGTGVRVPGRMEQVLGTGSAGEPLAVVDYAHTPHAVAAALAALADGGRPLVVVLGAGGDRDRDKRPLMGRAAALGADVVIVTDDNPRWEDPSSIRAALLDGARQGPPDSDDGIVVAEVLEVADRRHAVAVAVDRAWGNGTVLLAGKGHEHGQEVGATVTAFDDRAVMHDALVAAGRQRQMATAPQEEARRVAQATEQGGITLEPMPEERPQ